LGIDGTDYGGEEGGIFRGRVVAECTFELEAVVYLEGAVDFGTVIAES
jgi:hypothetical protein